MRAIANVMVAESCMPFAKAFITTLRKQGHKVERVRWFAKVEGELMYQPWNKSLRPVPKDVQVAFVDAMIDRPLTGAQAVQALTAHGVPCVGIAAMEDCNKDLLAAGAKFVLPKGIALAVIYVEQMPLDSFDHVTDETHTKLENIGKAARQDKVTIDALHELVERK